MAVEAAGENAKSDEEASTGSVVRTRGVSDGCISAEMGRIGRLDPIVSYCCSGQTGFYALVRWLVTECKGHTDGLDGTLVGQGWYGPTLAGAGTGAPPLVP